jgi:hypothetical protein
MQILPVYPAACMAYLEGAVAQISFCPVSGQCREKREEKEKGVKKEMN